MLPHEISAKIQKLNLEYRKNYIELMSEGEQYYAYDAMVESFPSYFP